MRLEYEGTEDPTTLSGPAVPSGSSALKTPEAEGVKMPEPEGVKIAEPEGANMPEPGGLPRVWLFSRAKMPEPVGAVTGPKAGAAELLESLQSKSWIRAAIDDAYAWWHVKFTLAVAACAVPFR